jgi:hypothetical protein
MQRLETIIHFVSRMTVLAGWALMFVSFLGFFLIVSGVLVYTVFKVDEIQARQISSIESQHLDSLTLTRYIMDLRSEIKQKNKAANTQLPSK